MKTLLLDQNEWDLVLDINGNIAAAESPYAVAQDVASAVRVFRGELWYNTADGIPYFEQVLGKIPNLQFLKSQIESEALKVPTVEHARCLFATFNDRVLTGQIQIIDSAGVTSNVAF